MPDLVGDMHDVNKQASDRMFRYDGTSILHYVRMWHNGDISFPRFYESIGDLERVHRDDILREINGALLPKHVDQRAREAGL